MLSQNWLNFILAQSLWYVNVLAPVMIFLCGETQIQIIAIYIHLFISSSERHPQETCLEHQCSIWFGHIVASLQTQVHSAGCQRHPCIGKIPTSIGTLDNHPRFGVKHQSTLRTDQDGGPTLKMCSLPVSGLLMSGWFCSLLWFLLLFCLVQRWSSRLVSGSNWCIQLRA